MTNNDVERPIEPITQDRGPCNFYQRMSMSDWCDHCGYPKAVHPQFHTDDDDDAS